MILDPNCLRALVFQVHACLSSIAAAASFWFIQMVRRIAPDAGRVKEVLHQRKRCEKGEGAEEEAGTDCPAIAGISNS